MKVTGKRGRLRAARKSEEINPMEGVGNMADAMLVFACGLLLALIISWNVNVSETGEIMPDASRMYEVNGMDGTATQQINENSNLEEMGTVYRDPATGKYYVMQEQQTPY